MSSESRGTGEKKGRIILVGGGPGDEELITLKGLRAVERAEVLVYDYLAPEELLAHAPEGCEKIYVGKKAGSHTMGQEQINRLLVEKAREGRLVVRLKGGDPFVFGRGGEEALEAAEAGVEFEVVPGVTAGVAVPAYAGIPVTQRGINTSVTFVTGHEDPSKEESDIDWASLARSGSTLVFYMGVGRLPHISRALTGNGRPSETPVAVIHRGTTRSQRTVTGTLADIAEVVEREKIRPPSIIIVGEVVSLRDRLSWYERKPLFGRNIMVTRSRAQASEFSALLREYGAAVVEFPTIRIAPGPDPEGVKKAVESLHSYDWVIFTSVNGVKYFHDSLLEEGRDARAFGGAGLCAIGPATAAALGEVGLRADLVPDTYVAEAVAEALTEREDIAGKRILLPRAEIARKALPDRLRQAGALVDDLPLYATEPGRPDNLEQVQQELAAGGVDVVTFTSSSTVENFVGLAGRDNALRAAESGTVFAAIGPITADKAAEYGLKTEIMPEDYTIPALAASIRDYFRDRG